MLHREGRPNQIMQVAQRLGAMDPAALDPDGHAYSSLADVMRAHQCREDVEDVETVLDDPASAETARSPATVK